jgi:hypothetical protein
MTAVQRTSFPDEMLYIYIYFFFLNKSFGVSYQIKEKLLISSSLYQSITCHRMRSP